MESRKASPDDHVHAALKSAIEVETTRYLWVPDDAITFVPRVCSRVFGDGRALIELAPVLHRPLFYVVRIDSAWDCDDYNAPQGAIELRDEIEEIYQALEDDFGRARDEDEDTGEETVDPWPAADFDGGSCWTRIKWPSNRGFALELHLFARHCDVLSEVRESSIVVAEPARVRFRLADPAIVAMAG